MINLDIDKFNENLQNIINSINEQKPDFLQRAKKTGYICPSCSNGTGESGTGITLAKDHKHYHCFVCGLHEDTLGLYKMLHQAIDTPTAIKELKERYNILDNVHPTNTKQANNKGDHPAAAAEMSIESVQPTAETISFLQAAYNDNDYIYLESRGISRETQQAFKIGKQGKYCIIPTEKGYLQRSTDESDTMRYKNPTGISTSLFNPAALHESTVVICEGAIDALSLEEIGTAACSCNSVANYKLVIEYLEQHSDLQPFMLLLFDKDQAGQTAQNELYNQLTAKGYQVKLFDSAFFPTGCKDINDFLRANRARLREVIAAQLGGREYRAADIVSDLFDFTDTTGTSSFSCMTGFRLLDDDLKGLHAGLYVLGAVSSLGKTTFLLQVADQIAAQGQDVIFISLEMSKAELIAKSLSRYTYLQARDTKVRRDNGLYPLAKDCQTILNKRNYKYLSPKEVEVLQAAAQHYSETAGQHLFIYEGRYRNERISYKSVGDIAREHIKNTGNKPVVIVDYLQILAPIDKRQTDKQNTDDAVFFLKELSRGQDIPVIAISSFNRDNYTQPVNLTSFKESGAIEYSSDVLLGLQYLGMDYQDGENDSNRVKRIRAIHKGNEQLARERKPIEVELKVLKNRTGYKCKNTFQMIAAYNYFCEGLVHFK